MHQDQTYLESDFIPFSSDQIRSLLVKDILTFNDVDISSELSFHRAFKKVKMRSGKDLIERGVLKVRREILILFLAADLPFSTLCKRSGKSVGENPHLPS